MDTSEWSRERCGLRGECGIWDSERWSCAMRDSVVATSIWGRSKDRSRRSISSLETYMKRWLTTPRTPVFPTQNFANSCSPQLPYFPLFLPARLWWKAKYWAPCRTFRGIIFLMLGWMSIFSCTRHYYSPWFPGKAVRLRDTDSLAYCSWLLGRGDMH